MPPSLGTLERALNKHGYPTFLSIVLMVALYMLYNDHKEATEKFRGTVETFKTSVDANTREIRRLRYTIQSPGARVEASEKEE